MQDWRIIEDTSFFRVLVLIATPISCPHVVQLYRAIIYCL